MKKGYEKNGDYLDSNNVEIKDSLFLLVKKEPNNPGLNKALLINGEDKIYFDNCFDESIFLY